MKSVLAFIIMAAVALSAAAQDRLFKELSDKNGIDATYISSALLSAVKTKTFVTSMGSVIAKDLKAFEVVRCDAPKTFSEIDRVVLDAVNKLKYETLLEYKDNDDDKTRTIIYGKPSGDVETVYDGLIVVNSDKEDYKVLYINGKIDITNIINHSLMRQ